MQILRAGTIVRVRQQRWRIADVRNHATCQVVALSGVGPANFGVELQVLASIDRIDQLDTPARLRLVRPKRWRQLCRGLLATSAPFDGLQTAGRARIELLPYQLEPSLALLRGQATRILIADEVGLGKTIEAALAICELRARGAADRVLILTPAGLREQWRTELADRFLLDASIVDMREARLRAARAPLGTNPWSMVPIAIASMDYVKRPEVLPSVSACRWDIVVIDEAHGAAPGSDRYEAASLLCRRASYVLLLSATPHNGDAAAFEGLCGLGAARDDRLVTFHRTRAETGLGSRRRIHQIRVQSSAAERVMHLRLGALADAISKEAADGVDTQLALAVLRKRASSSPWSLQRSIERRLSILGTVVESQEQTSLPFDDHDGEFDGSDAAPVWSSKGLNDVPRERELLESIAAAAGIAVHHDTKLRLLSRLLRRLDKRQEQAIVFTEYRDTLLHIRDYLERPCAVLHGGLSRDERSTAMRDFAAGRRTILLATDAAGEGLNLHHHCRVVINLELPWNPVRLEQRAGRVDRIGQRRTVHAFHLISTSGDEEKVFERLRARIDRARTAIDAPDPLASTPEFLIRRSVISGVATEHARLIRLRSLGNNLREAHADPSDLPALAFTRRRLSRDRLAGRALVLLRSDVEGETGLTISRNVFGALLQLACRFNRRQSIDVWRGNWRGIEASVSKLLPDSTADQESIQLHHAFWSTRLARDRWIVEGLSKAPARFFQAGLFDLRAEHAYRDAEDDRRELHEDNKRRLQEVIARLNAIAIRPRLALVLLP